MNSIEIKNLTVKYGKMTALNAINLEVPEGAIYGIVGPNGSGKTTLIKTLVGAIEPTEGNLSVLALDPVKDKYRMRKEIGYMPQSPALYDDMTARENVLFFGKARHIENLEARVTEIISFAGLLPYANNKVGTFSGGMKKRVSLCCALVNNPKIIFLDEPTAAVDPSMKLKLWSMFKKLALAGVTVIVTTHLMDEAMLCDKVTILRGGEILIVDTPQNILQKGKTKLTITDNSESKNSVIDTSPEQVAAELKKYGLSSGVSSVRLSPDTIEDVILEITGKKENIT